MNTIEKALATSILSVSTIFAGAASAQPPQQIPLSACTQLGQTKGVFEFPVVRKGFQDDVNQGGHLGCVFGYNAQGGFIPLQAYDLNDARQSQRFYGDTEKAKTQTDQIVQRQQNQNYNAANRAEQQAQREAQQNNPVNTLRQQARDLNSAAQSLNQIRNAGRFLQNLTK